MITYHHIAAIASIKDMTRIIAACYGKKVDRIQYGIQTVDRVSVKKLQSNASNYLNARKQPNGVQSIMNEQEVENFHNTNGTDEVLDDKHEEDEQRSKEMEVAVHVDSGTVADDVGVSMKSKELRKCKDKIGDNDWTVVTHKQGVGTVVDTLVRDNELNFVMKQGVQSNSSKKIICHKPFDALSVREEQPPSLGNPQGAHPKLANMLMQQHAASLVCPFPILKPLMDNLNTSAYEVSMQSMESFGEKQYDSGHQLIYVDNDQNMDKTWSQLQCAQPTISTLRGGKKGSMSVKSLADMAEKEG
ncbi:hypothetical protein K7X08_033801 [Anisodus acutangulus]|uniref:Uncharacterized protein n=1 Tax=Anisodus acutangulus TaxID=402998 RepID=A0A9Q1RCD4_9SOLA|nr:hypothetical protein K7X08_033801 [Anisodus acutangulus]